MMTRGEGEWSIVVAVVIAMLFGLMAVSVLGAAQEARVHRVPISQVVESVIDPSTGEVLREATLAVAKGSHVVRHSSVRRGFVRQLPWPGQGPYKKTDARWAMLQPPNATIMRFSQVPWVAPIAPADPAFFECVRGDSVSRIMAYGGGGVRGELMVLPGGPRRSNAGELPW